MDPRLSRLVPQLLKPTPYRKAFTPKRGFSPLKNYRLFLNLKEGEAATRLGVTRRTLQRYESGERPIPNHVYIMLAAGCLQNEHDYEKAKVWLHTVHGQPPG